MTVTPATRFEAVPPQGELSEVGIPMESLVVLGGSSIGLLIHRQSKLLSLVSFQEWPSRVFGKALMNTSRLVTYVYLNG